jgi:hypothetical protein
MKRLLSHKAILYRNIIRGFSSAFKNNKTAATAVCQFQIYNYVFVS